MPFKSIVAIIQNERDVTRILDMAIPFAKQHESHLIGMHADKVAMPYNTAIGFRETEFIQTNAELCKERAEKVQKAFLGRIETSGISFESRSSEGFSGDNALSGVESARCADLVIDPIETTAQSMDAAGARTALAFARHGAKASVSVH